MCPDTSPVLILSPAWTRNLTGVEKNGKTDFVKITEILYYHMRPPIIPIVSDATCISQVSA